MCRGVLLPPYISKLKHPGKFINLNMTASVEFLAANPEVLGSIPGATKLSA
jgi:hypothetical protein